MRSEATRALGVAVTGPEQPMPARTYGRWVQAIVLVMGMGGAVFVECVLRIDAAEATRP